MKKITDMKLSAKLILGGVLMVFVSMLVLGIISVDTASKALVDAGKGASGRIAKDLAMTTELFLAGEMKFAREISLTPVVKNTMEAVAENGVENALEVVAGMDGYLSDTHSKIGADYELFFAADADGNLFSDSKNGALRAKKINVADRDYFKAGKSGNAVVGAPIKSRVSGMPVVAISIPIKTASGRFAGVFATVLKLDALSDKLITIKLGNTGYPFLINKDGVIIAHPNKDFIFKLDLNTLEGMEDITRRMMAGETGNETYVFRGTRKIAGFAHIPVTGWSIGFTQNQEEFMAPVLKMKIYNGVAGVIILGVVAILIFFFASAIIKPVNEAVAGLKEISEGEGDLTKRLRVRGRDEIGVLSGAFNTFIEKLHAMISDITQGVDTLSSSSTELAAISDRMSESAGQTSDKSNAVAAAAEEMTTNMNSVSAAMEQSSANVNTVAGAAEEMNATISEIAKSAENARAISASAVDKVEVSTGKMNELGAAAQAIGQVVETITDISEQVNLLSVNATIEAARAGEAGKGFAVVANEIKDLANQTSDASMDIKARIKNIQDSSTVTLEGMGEVSGVITEVNDIVATIAAAVEEQSSATREIAENINQASSGIEEVNQNVSESSVVASDITRDISDVNLSSTDMADRSAEVQSSAGELSGLADRLDRMVNRFKI